MRMFRSAVSLLVTAMLGASALGVLATPAQASKPQLVITEENPLDAQVAWNAFKLKGVVTAPQADGTAIPYAGAKVKLQKKECGKCKWKTVKKLKTNDNGAYKTRIFAPRTGRWKWRTKVAGDEIYAGDKAKFWVTKFR